MLLIGTRDSRVGEKNSEGVTIYYDNPGDQIITVLLPPDLSLREQITEVSGVLSLHTKAGSLPVWVEGEGELLETLCKLWDVPSERPLDWEEGTEDAN